MDQVSQLLEPVIRWLHIIFGIIWIGHLYFFNFVNGPFAGTMDGETKKKVVPELMPRALFWFRWGAAWTWITGVLLLALVFYHGSSNLFAGTAEWSMAAGVMIAVTFLAVFLYDAMCKSPLGKDNKKMGVAGIVLIGVILAAMDKWAHFSYRGWSIHIGALFGTIMAYNVWFRIWPMQQKIITAIKGGQAPDPAWAALAGGRSRHNTYLSLPLLWSMINFHTQPFSGGNLGIPGDYAWAGYLVVVGLSWHIVWHFYRKAAAVKGF